LQLYRKTGGTYALVHGKYKLKSRRVGYLTAQLSVATSILPSVRNQPPGFRRGCILRAFAREDDILTFCEGKVVVGQDQRGRYNRKVKALDTTLGEFVWCVIDPTAIDDQKIHMVNHAADGSTNIRTNTYGCVLANSDLSNEELFENYYDAEHTDAFLVCNVLNALSEETRLYVYELVCFTCYQITRSLCGLPPLLWFVAPGVKYSLV